MSGSPPDRTVDPGPRFAFSTPTHLTGLIASILLPLIVFVAVLLYHYADTERARYLESATQVANQTAVDIDRELDSMIVALQTLATSPALRAHDFAVFDAQAREVLRFRGLDIALRDRTGQQWLNTRAPRGAPLPVSVDPVLRATDNRVIATASPQVSDLYLGAVSKQHQVLVEIPIIENGEVAYILNMTLAPNRLSDLLAAQLPSQEWNAAVIDRHDRIVARSRLHDRFIGEPATDDLRRKATGAEGFWIGRNLEGVPVLAAYERSTLSGWRIAVGVPLALVQAPVRRLLVIILTGAAAALALSLLLAAWYGRRLARPIALLAEAGAALARGDAVRRISSPVREVNKVSAVLADASVALRDRAREREEVAAELERKVAERTRELEAAQAQLVQSQKMDAIGQLTGGIAHDFNNLLASVLGNLELAEMRIAEVGGDPALAKMLANARRSGERGAKLTRDLLAFARKQTLRIAPVDLNVVIRGAEDLLQRSAGPLARIAPAFGRNLWPALADPGQMELVALNLVINARDAMPPSGGSITIETSNVASNDEDVPHDLPAGGEYVRMTVTDTGQGMTPDVLAKCLDPFFTTKDVGKGSGLGLSMIHGVVKQCGGALRIRSAAGQGTSVSIYLPRVQGRTVEQAAPTPGAAAGSVPASAGAGRVLVVDDDIDVREMTAAQLTSLGYVVTEAASGHAAVGIVERLGPGCFDLLVTDYAMPGMTGIDLARAVRARLPDLPVLLVTGYAEAGAGIAAVDESWNWLPKPFRQDQLAASVRQALRRRFDAAN